MSKELAITDSRGNILPVMSLDFESYYDIKSYSLSKMNTIEYVRDPRFKAHGCGVIYPDGFESWITHRDLPAFFNSIDWSRFAVLNHHANFDGFIMSEVYGKIPGYYLDTMAMSRGEFGVGVGASLHALSQRLGFAGKIVGELEKTSGIRDLTPKQEGALVPYAIQDVEQMKLSFEEMYFERAFPEQELHIIDLTVRTFTRPVLRVNAALCNAEIEAEDIRMKRLLESDVVGTAELSDVCANKLRTGGITELMRSRPCFAELLRSRGIEPPLKERMVKGQVVPGEFTYAFAKNDAALISLGDDPRVSDLVAVWTGLKSTLRKTRAESFLRATHDGTKTLPIPLVYCGGRTHRWSGSENLNPQNLNAGRDGRGSRLREAIEAPPGHLLVDIDLAQIELRVSAWISGETELLEDLRVGVDPYSKLATEIFGVKVAKDNENKHYRHVGKEGELSLGFGVGWKKFLNTIQTKYGLDEDVFSEAQAQSTVDLYRKKRIGIVQTWNEIREFIPQMAAGIIEPPGIPYKGIIRVENERVMMPNGLYMQYKDIHWHYDKEKRQGEFVYRHKKDWTRIYAAKMYENWIQCLARSIVAEQAVAISKAYPIVLLVHDQIMFLVREEEAEEALDFGLTTMRKAPDWCADIPLEAEGHWAKNYVK